MGITYNKMLQMQKKSSLLYAIGIDTGTNTGVAIWDCRAKKFALVQTMAIHEAVFLVQSYVDKAKKMASCKGCL